MRTWTDEEIGSWLKKEAKPKGSFVKVDIPNAYRTLNALGSFFKYKKHEWIAICFLDEAFACRLIWFNKGPDRRSVGSFLSIGKAVREVAPEVRARHLLIAHNHPLSSYDIPDYGWRSMNIAASYAHKDAITEFSEKDLETGDSEANACRQAGLGFAQAVLVAGDIKLEGDKEIVDNFRAFKPATMGCLVALMLVPWRSLVQNLAG
jgi:hypothetical protein